MRKLQDKITTHVVKSDSLSYVCAQMQGWRPNMQDSYISGINNIEEGISLFAVFDGHGGSHVSKYLQQHFIEEFKQRPEYKQRNYQSALQKTFQIIDKKLVAQEGIKKMATYLNNKSNAIRNKQSLSSLESTAILTGSTANVVLLTKQKIYVANCGDSRSAMYLNSPNQQNNIFSRYIELSQDHKPDSHAEKQRVQKAGGYVANGRVNANLSLSRALGDFYYKVNDKLNFKQQMITCHPQIKIYDRPKIKQGQLNFILIGCDGIWERFQQSSAGLLQLVKTDIQIGFSLEQSLKNLLNILVSRNVIQTKGKGCDNMTAILINLSQ